MQIVSPKLGGKAEFDETIKVLAGIFACPERKSFTPTRCRHSGPLRRPSKGDFRRSGMCARARRRSRTSTFSASDVRTEAYASFRYPYRVDFRRRRNPTGLGTIEQPPQFHDHPQWARYGEAAARRRRSFASARAIGSGNLRGWNWLVVLVGTVCERKGQLDFVRAIPLLAAELGRRLRFFIVGDRPSSYSDRLHEEAAGCRRVFAIVSSSCRRLGEPHRFMRAADIAVCSSRVESYPRVTLEAMAFGLPLITTPVFGIAEQVRDDVNGLFYKPGDVVALAKV